MEKTKAALSLDRLLLMLELRLGATGRLSDLMTVQREAGTMADGGDAMRARVAANRPFRNGEGNSVIG